MPHSVNTIDQHSQQALASGSSAQVSLGSQLMRTGAQNNDNRAQDSSATDPSTISIDLEDSDSARSRSDSKTRESAESRRRGKWAKGSRNTNTAQGKARKSKKTRESLGSYQNIEADGAKTEENVINMVVVSQPGNGNEHHVSAKKVVLGKNTANLVGIVNSKDAQLFIKSAFKKQKASGAFSGMFSK